MAPAVIRALFKSALRNPSAPAVGPDLSALGPLAARSLLVARDDDGSGDGGNGKEHHAPSLGALDPHDINNTAIFVVFGLIGAAIVVAGIWFFFWARNGGFHFRENDWDDYKSTVLRRKGPNGTTLSGATESTDLGGGSIYKDVEDDGFTATNADGRTVVSGTTGITGITGGVSDITGREKRRRKREQKEREKERRREEKTREKEERKRHKSAGAGAGRRVGRDGALIDEEAEAAAKEHLRSYRHERAARVGGINRTTDGSAWDGSTNPSHSTASESAGTAGPGTATASDMYTEAETGSTVTSDLMGNRQTTPTTTPTKKGGIRKVYSTADKTASREAERLRAEARRLQEKGREVMALRESATSMASPRRDFSWDRDQSEGPALRRIEEGEGSSSSSRQLEPRVPGSWADSEVGAPSEAGHKVYRHSVHVPGTATSDFAYTDEKRKKRNGAGHRRRDRAGESSR